jgi:ribosomal protein S18 acetylase RimI-like enzyme
MTTRAFSAANIDFDDFRVTALGAESCSRLAEAIVSIPPWSVMNYAADAMASFLATRNDGSVRYVIETGGHEAGVISLRSPWLKGPYLELLAIFPAFQGRRIGTQLLAWLEDEAVRHGQRNLWVCASSFNTGALRFYERHGFCQVACLPGLVDDNSEEILLRKYPLANVVV